MDSEATVEDAPCPPDIDDPYVGLVFSPDRDAIRLRWAASIADLDVFSVSAISDRWLAVDTVADSEGKHRVYGLDGDGELAWLFASIEEAFDGVAALLSKKAPLPKARAHDAYEKRGVSGRAVFDALLDLPLPEGWDAFADGQWPLVRPTQPRPSDPEAPGFARMFALWATERFLQTRRVELPDWLRPETLGAAQRDLVTHLERFERAMAKAIVPDLVERAAEHPDDVIAERASTWIGRHEAYRAEMTWEENDDDDRATSSAPPPSSDEEEEPQTPFARHLREALGKILDTFVEEGVVELVAGGRDPLLRELVIAGSDAQSAKHLLSRLSRSMLDSEHVEELYATDEAIEDRLKRALGG
jgi:hypothetical protein